MCYREKAKQGSLSSAREQEEPQTGSYGDTHSAIAFWQESQQSGAWQPMRSDSRPYPGSHLAQKLCVHRRECWSHIDLRTVWVSGQIKITKWPVLASSMTTFGTLTRDKDLWQKKFYYLVLPHP